MNVPKLPNGELSRLRKHYPCLFPVKGNLAANPACELRASATSHEILMPRQMRGFSCPKLPANSRGPNASKGWMRPNQLYFDRHCTLQQPYSTSRGKVPKGLEKDIGALETAINDSDDFKALLTSPLYSREEQAGAMAAQEEVVFNYNKCLGFCLQAPPVCVAAVGQHAAGTFGRRAWRSDC